MASRHHAPRGLSADRMKGFVIMMLMAGLFFSLAFFIGLPMVRGPRFRASLPPSA